MVKGIQIFKYGGSEVLTYTEINLPTLKAKDVLIKNMAIGVNYIDTYFRSGIYPTTFPHIPGQEGAGIIESIGSGVTNFKVGDRVVYLAPASYSEKTVASENKVALLPPNLSFDIGAASLVQGLTGLTMIQEAYKVKNGDFILIHAAAGGMGLILTQLCKSYGSTVIGTTSSDAKAEVAKKAGADYVIDYTKENVVDKVMEITSGKGVQAVLDGVGKDTFDISLKCCDYNASFISFGNASGKVPPVDIMNLSAKNIKLMRTSLFNFFHKPESFAQYTKSLFDLISQDKLSIFIFKSYPLKDSIQAHEDLEGRKTTGKLILVP